MKKIFFFSCLFFFFYWWGLKFSKKKEIALALSLRLADSAFENRHLRVEQLPRARSLARHAPKIPA